MNCGRVPVSGVRPTDRPPTVPAVDRAGLWHAFQRLHRVVDVRCCGCCPTVTVLSGRRRKFIQGLP
ncbi:hypothetical protein, partial [Frankia sp. CiP3]|uniref:hypothetical protein n=1 Tax=Frankia sp. CiP3 TaxID=2880971 RepID=UPI001EF679CD